MWITIEEDTCERDGCRRLPVTATTTTEPKRSPLPWRIQSDDVDGDEILSETGCPIAAVYGTQKRLNPHNDREICRANARTEKVQRADATPERGDVNEAVLSQKHSNAANYVKFHNGIVSLDGDFTGADLKAIVIDIERVEKTVNTIDDNQPHSPLPWRLGGPFLTNISGKNGEQVAVVGDHREFEGGDYARANAIYLVKAANSYPALVEALKLFLAMDNCNYDLETMRRSGLIEQAKEALRLTGEELKPKSAQ